MKRARTKKKIFYKENIAEAFSYINESRKHIYAVIALFVLSAVLGFIFSSKLEFLDEMLKGILDKTENLNGIELILFIFTNNLSVSFFVIFLGAIFGLFPIINSLLNGVVLGYVFAKVYSVSGLINFWRILPHGIFELPAVFISMGLGIKLGMSFFNKEPIFEFKRRFVDSMKVLIFVIIPLLILAALIEGTLIALMR